MARISTQSYRFVINYFSFNFLYSLNSFSVSEDFFLFELTLFAPRLIFGLGPKHWLYLREVIYGPKDSF